MGPQRAGAKKISRMITSPKFELENVFKNSSFMPDLHKRNWGDANLYMIEGVLEIEVEMTSLYRSVYITRTARITRWLSPSKNRQFARAPSLKEPASAFKQENRGYQFTSRLSYWRSFVEPQISAGIHDKTLEITPPNN